MNTKTFLGLTILAGLAGATYWMARTPEAAHGAEAARGAEVRPVASPSRPIIGSGRVEPYSEEVLIGSEFDGRLRRVPVEEGDHVKAGQIVAELDSAETVARIALAKSLVREREAALERLKAGSRQAERREAAATVREAEAVLANARAEEDRRRSALDRGAISRSEFEVTAREAKVAQARLEAARERTTVIVEETRIEDVHRVEAEIESAKARVQEAEALHAKTVIRSPIDGIVLRRRHRAGESISRTADPILSVGNTDRLRVRVDVDEDDVARLKLGAATFVTATTYGDQKFPGKVARIGSALGRKNIRSDEPTERMDLKILETLIDLDPGVQLPVGLRVDARITAGGAQ